MEFIQHHILLIVIAIVSGGMLAFTSFRPGGKGNALNSTQATLLINREDAQVIDVREPDEYVAGHLPESRNFPLGRLGERAGELDKLKDSPILVVCQTGARSASACTQLAKLGFTKTHNLDGGINAWRSAGLPLKKGSKK